MKALYHAGSIKSRLTDVNCYGLFLRLYTVSKDEINERYELERMWKEAVVD
jgi:hypothetical protein